MSYCVHRGMALSFRSTGCRNHFKQELGLDDNISSPLGKTSGESWMKRGGADCREQAMFRSKVLNP